MFDYFRRFRRRETLVSPVTDEHDNMTRQDVNQTASSRLAWQPTAAETRSHVIEMPSCELPTSSDQNRTSSVPTFADIDSKSVDSDASSLGHDDVSRLIGGIPISRNHQKYSMTDPIRYSSLGLTLLMTVIAYGVLYHVYAETAYIARGQDLSGQLRWRSVNVMSQRLNNTSIPMDQDYQDFCTHLFEEYRMYRELKSLCRDMDVLQDPKQLVVTVRTIIDTVTNINNENVRRTSNMFYTLWFVDCIKEVIQLILFIVSIFVIRGHVREKQSLTTSLDELFDPHSQKFVIAEVNLKTRDVKTLYCSKHVEILTGSNKAGAWISSVIDDDAPKIERLLDQLINGTDHWIETIAYEHTNETHHVMARCSVRHRSHITMIVQVLLSSENNHRNTADYLSNTHAGDPELMTSSNETLRFTDIESTLRLMSRCLYAQAEQLQTDISQPTVIVTWTDEKTQHILTGYGHVHIGSFPVFDGVCQHNLTPGGTLFICNLSEDQRTASLPCIPQHGLKTYIGGRFTSIPGLSMCVISFISKKQSETSFNVIKHHFQRMFKDFDQQITYQVKRIKAITCEKTLRQSIDHFLNSTRDGFIVSRCYTADRRIENQNVSRSICDLLGLDRQTMLSSDFKLPVSSELIPRIMHAMERLFAGEDSVEVNDVKIMTHDGMVNTTHRCLVMERTERWIRVCTHVIVDNQTPTQRCNQRLADMFGQNKSFFIASASIADGIILSCHGKTCLKTLLGYDVDEFVGVSGYVLMHPDDQKNIQATASKVMSETSDPDYSRFRRKRRDGTYTWVHSKCITFDQSSNVMTWIEWSAEAEQQQLQEINRYKLLNDQAAAMLYEFTWDRRTNEMSCPYASSGAMQTTGFTAEQVMQDVNILIRAIDPDCLESFQTALVESANSMNIFDWTGMFIFKHGKRWINARSQPFVVSDHVIRWIGMFTDVHDKETKSAELRSMSKARDAVATDLTQLLETANAPIFGIDTKGLINVWNRKAASLTGYTKHETMGKQLIQFITPDYRVSVQSVLDAAQQSTETSNYEFPLFTKSGDRLEILLNATTRRGADGVVTGVIGIGQNITELRSMSKARDAVATDLTQLLETANAPIFGIDIKGLINVWNRKAASLTGYTKHETMGKPLIQFITPDYRVSVQSVLDAAQQSTETSNYEFPLFTKSGDRLEILLNATTRRGADGVVTGVIGIGQNITELRKSEGVSKGILESVKDLVTLTENNSASTNVCSYVSKSYLDYGLDLAGQDIDTSGVIRDKDIDTWKANIKRFHENPSKPHQWSQPFIFPDGSEVWFEHKLQLGPNGAYRVMVSRDITERRRRHELEKEQVKAQTRREKDLEATRIWSHEIKNRFSAIFGLADKVIKELHERGPHLMTHTHNIRSALEDIEKQARQGKTISKNQSMMLEMAHGEYNMQARLVNLKQSIKELLGSRIRIVDEVQESVSVDSNLVLHATDNMYRNGCVHGGKAFDPWIKLTRDGTVLVVMVTNAPGSKHEYMRKHYDDPTRMFQVDMTKDNDRSISVDSNGEGVPIIRMCCQYMNAQPSIYFHKDRVETLMRIPDVFKTDQEVSINGTGRLDTPRLLGALDDTSGILAMYHQRFRAIGADPASQHLIRGKTPEEIDTYPLFISEQQRQPDVLLLDQNLNHPVTRKKFRLGTRMIPRLRDLGFRGKIIICSANTNVSDTKRYIDAGADGVMDKDDIVTSTNFVYRLDQIIKGVNDMALARGSRNPTMIQSVVCKHLQEFDPDAVQTFMHDFNQNVEYVTEGMQNLPKTKAYDELWETGLHGLKGTCKMLCLSNIVPACEVFRSLEQDHKTWLKHWLSLQTEIKTGQYILKHAMSKLSLSKLVPQRTQGKKVSAADSSKYRRKMHVIIADDSKLKHKMFAKYIENKFPDATIEHIWSGEQLLTRINNDDALLRGNARALDMIMLDNCFGVGNIKGLDVLRRLRSKHYDGQITMISGDVERGVFDWSNITKAPPNARIFLDAGANYATSNPKKAAQVLEQLYQNEA